MKKIIFTLTLLLLFLLATPLTYAKSVDNKATEEELVMDMFFSPSITYYSGSRYLSLFSVFYRESFSISL